MSATRRSTRVRRPTKFHDAPAETSPKDQPSDGVYTSSGALKAVGNDTHNGQPARNAKGKRAGRSLTPSRVSQVEKSEEQSLSLTNNKELGNTPRKRRKVDIEASMKANGVIENSCPGGIQEMDAVVAATPSEPIKESKTPETEQGQSRASSAMRITNILNLDASAGPRQSVDRQVPTSEQDTQIDCPAPSQHEDANDLGAWLRQMKDRRKATDSVRQAQPSSRTSILGQTQTDTSNGHASQTLTNKSWASITASVSRTKRSWSSATDSTETSSGKSKKLTSATAAVPATAEQLAIPKFMVAFPLSDSTTNISPLTLEKIKSLVPARLPYTLTDPPASDSFQIPGPGEENDLYWANGSPRFVIGPRKKIPTATNSQATRIWKRPRQGLKPELEWRKRNGWVEKRIVEEIGDDEDLQIGGEPTVTRAVITL